MSVERRMGMKAHEKWGSVSDGLLCLIREWIFKFPFSFCSERTKNNQNAYTRESDIESEPPPEPAPPEVLPPSHRDISMASIHALTIKPPSNFVLKIDKNGDQIHEEFIPQSQHGKLS